MSEAFAGSVIVVSNSTPSNPRTWADIATWATGERGMLGGSPAASVTFRNRMIYPKTGYTVGTDAPPIQIYDGSFDHELCRLPPTSAGVVPTSVLSMLAANGTIYLSSFDTGTTAADWAGRVFSLDVASGKLTPIGDPFTGGQLPYALAWHMGRLWVGTTNGAGAGGALYYCRPDIDTAWTVDHRLTSGGVNAMQSYRGQLYVGTDGATGVLGTVLARSALGAYTVVDTGADVTPAYDLVPIFRDTIVSPALFAQYDAAGAWPIDDTDTFFLPGFDTFTVSTGLSIPPDAVLFPASAPTPSPSGGGSAMVAGYYGYSVTFVMGTYETPAPPQSQSYSGNFLGFGAINLANIVTGPSGVTARKVYRTSAQADAASALSAQLKLLTTISDNTTTTYLDLLADASLGANVPPSTRQRRDTAALNTVVEDALATTQGLTIGAILNNGYLAMAVFDDALYATYWNHGSTATSVIRKYDGTTWSTAYTGVDDTLRPFIVLFEDSDLLFAVAGGMSLTGALVSTPDGATWTDKTSYLPETDKTLLPVYGVEVL